MQSVRDMSINRKITLVAMAAAITVLLISWAVGFVHQHTLALGELCEELETHARVIAVASAQPLVARDSKLVSGLLTNIETEPEVEAVCVFDKDGRLFASYRRDDQVTLPRLDERAADWVGIKRGHIQAVRHIEHEGVPVGTVLVQADLSELRERVFGFIAFTAVAVAISLVVSLILVRRLRQVISRPIQNLADVARLASEHHCNVRAIKPYRDETGELIDAFNHLLDQVQDRDRQLDIAWAELEQQVAERTAELVKANEELQLAKHRAEAANQAKSQFVANISHEIRTPMTAILGYVDMMLEPDQTLSDRHDSLQVVRRNAYHLLGLINDILDISRIESDKLAVERARCDLPGLLAEVSSLIRPRATEKELEFSIELRTAVPQQVFTDPLRLRQILLNLLGNAIKFTESGSVALEVCHEPDRQPSLRFDVIDTGIGIDPGQYARIFQPFAQCDDSMTRKYGGTGLGLTISRRLARLLGGDIEVGSRPGLGSTFTVRIDPGDLKGVVMVNHLRASSNAEITPPKVDLAGTRILLAEDGPDNQRLIGAHLRGAGAQLEIVSNGRQALQKVFAEPFDLVLMDMQMPELDGYAATSQMRLRGQRLPIIALTAHAMQGDRERCLRAGCTDYLAKPVSRDRLLDMVQKYVEKTMSTTPITQATARAPSPDATSETSGTPALRSGFRDDPDMREIIDEFVAALPEKVVQMQQLLNSQDLDSLRRVVHQLKGAGGGYGFDPITEYAAKAEAAIKSQAPEISVQQQVKELVDLVRSVEGYQEQREKTACHSAS